MGATTDKTRRRIERALPSVCVGVFSSEFFICAKTAKKNKYKIQNNIKRRGTKQINKRRFRNCIANEIAALYRETFLQSKRPSERGSHNVTEKTKLGDFTKFVN